MKRFFVGIKGVIEKDGNILLLRTNDRVGRGDRWEFPGGRIDDRESIQETLVRELEEELPGLENIKVHELLGAQRLQKDISDSTSLFLVFYRVSADFPNGINLSDEHIEAKWCSYSEAKSKIDHFGHQIIDALSM